MIKYFKLKAFAIMLLIVTGSCKKQDDWLDAKNSKSLVVPENLKDFQAILDDQNTVLNHFPLAGQVGADNYFLIETNFNTLDLTHRNLYTWQPSIWANDRSIDWEYSYTLIEYANIVIDGLQKLKEKETNQYRFVLGQAYFLRALAFYNLAQLFCTQYTDKDNESPGLPLRNTSDVNVLFKRSNLKETYDMILSDAERARQLMDDDGGSIYRASGIAADALLAKTYLIMGNYQNALSKANNVLKVKSSLLDYNSTLIDAASTFKFPASGRANPEIIFYGEGTGYNLVMPSISSPSYADSLLISMYGKDDLRLKLFFTKDSKTNYYRYSGSYTGSNMGFCGIGVNEILLIRAECLARLNQPQGAGNDLQLLWSKRYKTGAVLPAVDKENLLSQVLTERRMELPFTANIRWEDLRRLNESATTQADLIRNIGANQYILKPGDKKYTLPIPEFEIQLSGITQNER